MPSYRTHISVNLFFGLPLALAALKYTVQSTPMDTVSFIGAFIYGTFFLHPDLDLSRNVRLLSLKGLLTFPFRPYSYLFRHRGISHMPVIGTATRILWLLGFLWVVFTFFDWVYPNWSHWGPPLWFGIAGIAVADLYHSLLDKLI